MKKYLLLFLLTGAVAAEAQVPEDVLRYSFFPQNGTARSMAIGGAMGSLGGDITATFVNPAGLGNYKTGEAVFSPGYFFNNNKADFRETLSRNKKNAFGIGTMGVVYGESNYRDKTSSQAISIAFMQQASYNNTQYYKGYNNFSSAAEQWAEAVAGSGLSLDDILNSPAYAYGAAPAVYTYLVDTFRNNNNALQVKALPEFLLESGMALQQEKTIATRGGLYELALGFAFNKKDKVMWGGSIGIPIVYYDNTTTIKETDTSMNTANGFGSFTYTDQYSTRGAGVNFKFGMIFKPVEYVRLGFAVHSPSLMFSLKDRRSTSLDVDTENYNGVSSVTSAVFTNGLPGESRYTMLMPWRFMVSGSYVIREEADVRRQKGFITADIEYVRHRASRFYSAQEQPDEMEKDYFRALNRVIKGEYKGNFNFRVGGELKFNIIMARLGFSYYTNPYADKALKANRMLLSGGLGYRHRGFFVDLTYVHAYSRDVDFAYRLADKSNTFATVKNQRGNVVASIGVKF
ncbi:MAG TPA: hypothetical protein PKC39_09585 [Ferruginibacter sp.]|nr:hypothetical protein [Ferruginibacter sp.]HMP21198.1 hypothetical protein [Ferruginibacter sp.]